MSKEYWRLESYAGDIHFPGTTQMRITRLYSDDTFTKQERQQIIMIENFCKEPYQENPPHPYIEQLANHAHACIKTYYKLWRTRDKKNTILILQANLPHTLNIQPQKFIRDVIDICNEGLCSWAKVKKNKKQYIQIELVGWAYGDDNQD